MEIFFVVVTLIFFAFNLYGNYFHFKWDLGAALFAVFISYTIGMVTNYYLAALLLYMLLSSLYIGHVTHNKHFAHPPPGKGINPALSTTALKSYIAILLFMFAILYFPIVIADYLKYILLLGCIWTLIPDRWVEVKNVIGVKNYISGLGGNMSVDATLLSLLSPFVLINYHQYDWIILVITAIALLKNRCAAGTTAFFVSQIFFWVIHTNFNIYLMGGLGIALLSSLMFVLKRQRGGKNFFDLSGRDAIWSYIPEKIMPLTNKWLGIGAGAYQVIMPAIQRKFPLKNFKARHNAIWAHNDILQFYCEGGIIGMVLLAAAFISILVHLVLTQNLIGLTYLIAYSINSFANFPNHMAPDCMLTAMMIKFSYISL